MGLMLAEPRYHTRAFVEWEEYPRSVIIAAQRAGYFAPAPIWDDLTTFDARPLAGAIDTLIAGYPCQPFSLAGQRRGENDPRHLWPHVARVTRELGDGLEWIFLENVAGHLTLGGETVLRGLWDMGFTPAAGIFSAGETGAPHERQRLFIVAHREGRGRGIVGDAAQPGGGGYADGGDKPVDDARCSKRRAGIEAGNISHGKAPGWIKGASGSEQSSGDVENAISAGAGSERGAAGQRGRDALDGRSAGIRCGDGALGADGHWADGRQLAAASQPGPQGREWPGTSDQRDRAPASRSAAQCGGIPLFPPGPGDSAAWSAVMAANPDRAPSVARRDVVAAAVNLAAILDPDAAAAVEPALRGVARGAGVAAVVGAAPELVGEAQALTRLRNLADGLANRTRALRLLGNGVFPLAAANAWRTLAAAHGLWPVDLDAACDGDGGAADEPVRGGVTP